VLGTRVFDNMAMIRTTSFSLFSRVFSGQEASRCSSVYEQNTYFSLIGGIKSRKYGSGIKARSFWGQIDASESHRCRFSYCGVQYV